MNITTLQDRYRTARTVLGLARLDDLDQLIHIIVFDSAATGVHNHSLKGKHMSNQEDLHGNT